MRGAQLVLHVASPFPAHPPKDESRLIVPAREGTLRVLRAASRAGARRVVLTSSIAAIVYGTPRAGTHVYDEDSWSDATQDIGAYPKSKTLAERAAWDFVQALPPERPLELVTVHPGLVLGPVLDGSYGTSIEITKRLLTGAVPGCPRLCLPHVDVRDVAKMHRLALITGEAAGQRFICAGESAWMVDVARILQRHFGPRGYRVPTREIPNWLVHVVALFDASARPILKDLGQRREVSHERASRVLGWTPRSLEEMVVATGESLIEHGVV